MRWLIALLVLSAPVQAMPVVPNFRTGTMTSRTESTTQVTETIRSVDFATGYTYSASGTNVQHSGTSMLPSAGTVQTQTVDGVTSSWTGLALDEKPAWSMTNQGASFQFVESYIESVTDTTSVFGP
jgi:hypothetical protein